MNEEKQPQDPRYIDALTAVEKAFETQKPPADTQNMKMTMTQRKTKKRPVEEHVTETYRGFTGPGWELSVTGRPAWVKKMVKKLLPEIQQIASAL